MTDRCVDQKLGRLLPEYEMALLDREAAEQFEQHLMTCDFCFAQIEAFAPVAKELRADALRDELARREKETDWQSLPNRIIGWLWPKDGPWLKPAVALILIILLLPMAWRGFHESQLADDAANPAVELTVTRQRGAEQNTISVPLQSDLIVRFGFEPEIPEQAVGVTLVDPNRRVLFEDDSYLLDRSLSGRLTVPWPSLVAGEYVLIIHDPHAAGPLAVDTLEFEVVLPSTR